jgi:uncharacterized membrane protein YqjE
VFAWVVDPRERMADAVRSKVVLYIIAVFAVENDCSERMSVQLL